jgi:ribonuclease HI
MYCSGVFDIVSEHLNSSNMQCEWNSLVETLEYLKDNLYSGLINITTDSLFLFKQLTWEYRIKSKKLKPYYFEWNKLKNNLSGVCDLVYNYCSGNENPARSGVY